MTNRSIAFLAALSLLSFAGCKKKGGSGDGIAKLTEFRDQMCKCTDEVCAEKVTEQMTRWSKEMIKTAGDTVSEEDTKKMAAITEEVTRCTIRAMKGGADEAVAKLTEFKDEMCECADKACANKVTEAMTKWSRDLAKTASDKAGVSKGDTKMMAAITEGMTKCTIKAVSGAADEVISKMVEFKDEMCKCSDTACADKVAEEMTRWGREMARTAGGKQLAISEEDSQKMAAITEEMTKCMTEVMRPGR